MDAADFYQISLSAIVESGQMHRNPLADESERVFTPAGHPPDRAVYSIRPVAASSMHGSRICPTLYRRRQWAIGMNTSLPSLEDIQS